MNIGYGKVSWASDLFSVDNGKQFSSGISDDWQKSKVLSGLRRVLTRLRQRTKHFRLMQLGESYSGKTGSKKQIERVLQSIIDNHLMMKDGEYYLSLAIPVASMRPTRGIERFQWFLQRMTVNEQHEGYEKIRIKSCQEISR